MPAFAQDLAIIPQPTKSTPAEGRFVLTSSTRVVVDRAELKPTAELLLDIFAPATGLSRVVLVGNSAPADAIFLTLHEADAALGSEGYALSIRPGGITIRANTPAGLFYGMQTLRQMLPPQIESRTTVSDVDWAVACGEIVDTPRFAWRGLMLDCARHFFSVDETKRFIDLMVLHKFNHFHWHLSDDQGWRVEIKKWPRLTEVGAWRDGVGFGLEANRTTHYRASDGQYGGFYTQDQIRDVVAYAAARHVTIVPEIDVPGHSTAAIVAYPELGTTKEPMEMRTVGGVSEGILDPTDERTYQFLDDVISELVPLFPGEYFHVGGDEVPKGPWKKSERCQAMIKDLGLKDEDELQSHFMHRVEKMVEAKGKRLIGWDEILEGGLPANATVMSWRGVKGAIAAAQQGHDTVLSPNTFAYLDYGQTKVPGEPKVIGGFLPIEKVYGYEPIPTELTAEQAKHILGVQGNVWTEYMPNFEQVERMAYPRALALAEVAWSPAGTRDFANFERRLAVEKKRLDAMGVKYFAGQTYPPGGATTAPSTVPSTAPSAAPQK